MDKLKNKQPIKTLIFLWCYFLFWDCIYFNFENKYLDLSLSFIFFVLGFFNSKLLSPLNYIWFKIGIFLGNIISPLVMLIIYFLIVTPISILLRVFKRIL